MKCLIIGASAGLGRSLASVLAQSGRNLVLVASDCRDLDPLASDLGLRCKVSVDVVEADISNLNEEKLRKISLCGPFEDLFFIAGYSDPENDFAMLDFRDCERIVRVNFLAAVQIINQFLYQIVEAKGRVVAIGSVAQARPRSANTVYAASKQALEFFMSGVQHKYAHSGAKFQFIRVGYMDTSMNRGASLLPKADPMKIARKVLDLKKSTVSHIYLPWWWFLIMTIYRMIPRLVFNRLK